MLNRHPSYRYFVLLLISFVLVACKTPWNPSSSADTPDRSTTETQIPNINVLFDWNKQDSELICTAIKANNNLISIGVAFSPNNIESNIAGLDALEMHINANFSNSVVIVGRENRLSILNVQMNNCSELSELRVFPGVEFVEAKYVTPLSESDIFESSLNVQTKSLVTKGLLASEDLTAEHEEENINPGLYNPATAELSYVEYISQIEEKAADRMNRHGMNKIYEEFGFYGSPTLGVAIMDNGVFDDRVEFLSQGGGFFEAEGYLKTAGAFEADGPNPQPYDLFGLMPAIKTMYAHGTTQTNLVYTMAPNINIKSVRASSFVFWFIPIQFQGVVDSIMALAEDPTIRVISSSMATIVHVHEIERAIEYFNARDKIYISAGGTSAPYFKELIDVVFPANLTSTIAVTGIKSTLETNGKMVLGRDAHGGPEIDFVVDHSTDSSQSVSSTAGMVGLLWSYNPTLNREQIINVLIQSTENYNNLGKKDPVFGWGKIDMYNAFIKVKELSE